MVLGSDLVQCYASPSVEQVLSCVLGDVTYTKFSLYFHPGARAWRWTWDALAGKQDRAGYVLMLPRISRMRHADGRRVRPDEEEGGRTRMGTKILRPSPPAFDRRVESRGAI